MRQPLFHLNLSVTRRWSLNFALWVVFSILTTLVLRISPIALASARPGDLGFLPFSLIVDLSLWLSHFSMHRFGVLWVWHAIHHSDSDMDASTGLRFHPVEALWDTAVQLGLVWLLRPDVSSVVAFQFLAIASNFLVHANAALPPSIEKALQWIFMTPGLHRPHHSIDPNGQKGNYGIILSVWDRLFRTLHHQSFNPQCGIEGDPPAASIQPLHVLATLPWREWKKL
jgi:sterol desaturase/sphingolipid hydroxylase (fatty acid hydroxylase superfamily)